MRFEGFSFGSICIDGVTYEYAVTGVKTFIVSDDGVVYEKDFGNKTLDEFVKMERSTRTNPVLDQEQ